MLSSAVTNFSKKRQVRRALSRSACASAGGSGLVPANGGGRLAHRAIAGANIQRITNGAATNRRRVREPDKNCGRGAQRDAAGHAAGRIREDRDESSTLPAPRSPTRASSMTYEQTIECPYNRVGHQPCLMREQGKEHRDLRAGGGEIGANRAQMAALGNPEAARHESGDERQHRRQRNRRENEPGPDPGGSGSAASIPQSMR